MGMHGHHHWSRYERDAMTEKPNVTPLMGEAEFNEALKLIGRVRLTHNGDYVLSPIEAAVLIHQHYMGRESGS